MSTKAVLSAPLPRVYEETHAGKVVPLNASQASGAGGQQAGGGGQVVMPIGGTDFNAEELAKISKETSKKIESEVLAPMERWMNAYNLVQAGVGGGRVSGVECGMWVGGSAGRTGEGPAGVVMHEERSSLRCVLPAALHAPHPPRLPSLLCSAPTLPATLPVYRTA